MGALTLPNTCCFKDNQTPYAQLFGSTEDRLWVELNSKWFQRIQIGNLSCALHLISVDNWHLICFHAWQEWPITSMHLYSTLIGFLDVTCNGTERSFRYYVTSAKGARSTLTSVCLSPTCMVGKRWLTAVLTHHLLHAVTQVARWKWSNRWVVVIHGLGDLGVSEERLPECKTTFLSCHLSPNRVQQQDDIC